MFQPIIHKLRHTVLLRRVFGRGLRVSLVYTFSWDVEVMTVALVAIMESDRRGRILEIPEQR